MLPGQAVEAAKCKRRDTYPELGRARRCRLVVVGVEVGSMLGAKAAQLLRRGARLPAGAYSLEPYQNPRMEQCWSPAGRCREPAEVQNAEQ